MNYYDVLGVSKSATSEEIKKAYKKLVMQHHPDRGGDHEKFTEINTAYEILGDPKKRQEYDNPPINEFKFDTSNFNRNDIHDIFSQIFGRDISRMQRKNKDVRISLTITLEEVALGKEVLASYHLPSSRLENVTLKIPPGVRDGETVKITGLGDDSVKGLHRGDLLILIRVLPHATFSRDNNNLSIKQPVSVFDLMCGTELIIEDLTGSKVCVNIKPGTQPGTILSVNGHGLPDVRTGIFGNLYIHIRGTLPTVSDSILIEKINDLKNEINNSTR